MIHGSSHSLQNVGVGLLKDPTLMSTFSLPPPSNLVEVEIVGTCNMISSIQKIFEHFSSMDHRQVLPPSTIEILYQSIFSTWAANPNQHSSSVWVDRSKEYGTSSDPWSHVHSTDEGIIQSMMIEEAPWEDYDHRSHLPGYKKDYSNDLDHPSVSYFLFNIVNTMDSK